MACISKLANAIAYDCDSGATGLVSALIINKSDIVSFGMSSDGLGIVSLAIAEANRVFKIDTVKRTATASSALKVNDGAPNAFTHSVSLTITSAEEAVHSAISRAISNGRFVVLVKRASGLCQVYGLYYGYQPQPTSVAHTIMGVGQRLRLKRPKMLSGKITYWLVQRITIPFTGQQ